MDVRIFASPAIDRPTMAPPSRAVVATLSTRVRALSPRSEVVRADDSSCVAAVELDADNVRICSAFFATAAAERAICSVAAAWPSTVAEFFSAAAATSSTLAAMLVAFSTIACTVVSSAAV